VAGYAWFLERKFAVNSSVLIPRQETEELALMTLKKAGTNYLGTVIDFCTGSGCIAISLALSLPEAKIYATDISDSALKTASENCSIHGVKVSLLNHDLLYGEFSSLPPASIIVANPPYVRESGGWFCFEINEALGKELVSMFSVNFITNLNLIDDINSKNRFIGGTRV
jgi:release factor glutamine methyltransferase